VAEIGPIPAIPAAPRYELRGAEAAFGPEMNPAVSNAVHTHSRPAHPGWLRSFFGVPAVGSGPRFQAQPAKSRRLPRGRRTASLANAVVGSAFTCE
jgi:hypothetical protein